jgi:hypothetical protein
MPKTAARLALVGVAVTVSAMLSPATATAAAMPAGDGSLVLVYRYFSGGELVGQRGCDDWGIVTSSRSSMYLNCDGTGG